MTQTASSHIELDNFWPYRAVVLADQISRFTLSVVRENTDLNLSQWRVLAAVAEKPGRTAADVTAITPMDKTIVSRAVSSLIEDEFIIKTIDRSDKRRSSLSPTKQGQAIYVKVAARLNTAMVNMLGNNTKAANFTQTLSEFSDFMEALEKAEIGSERA